MADERQSKDALRAYRDRMKYEDKLLNTRTNIVIAMNGLAAVAVGLKLQSSAKIVVAGAVIVIDLIWTVCASDALYFIGRLSEELRDSKNLAVAVPDEAFRHKVQRGRFRLGTSRFVAVVIPGLLFIAWVLGLILALHTR